MARRVSAKEAFDLVEREGYVLVDVRSVPEFEAGHPAGAFNVPWMHIDARGRSLNDEFIPLIEKLFPDRDAKLVLSCQSGNRSMQALSALEARGYRCLVDQRAGWGGQRDSFGRLLEPGWKETGLPIAYGDGGARSYEALRRR